MSNTEENIEIEEKYSTIEKESVDIDHKQQQVADDFVGSGGSDIQNINTAEPQIETLDVDTNFHHELESSEVKDLDAERSYFDNYVQSGNECVGTSVVAPASPELEAINQPIATVIATEIDPYTTTIGPIATVIEPIATEIDTVDTIDAIIVLRPQDIDFDLVVPVTEPIAITPPAIIESPIELPDPFIDSTPEPIIDPFVNDGVIAIDNSGYTDAVAIYGDLPSVDDILVIEQDDLFVDAVIDDNVIDEIPIANDAISITPEIAMPVVISIIGQYDDYDSVFIDVN